MSLLERYINQYVQITIDPRTLPKDINRDGIFCYIGRLTKVDEHFALFGPVDVYRPEAPDCGIPMPSVRDVVESLKQYEERAAAHNVVELSDRFEEGNPTARINRLLNDSIKEKLVPLISIVGVKVCKEY